MTPHETILVVDDEALLRMNMRAFLEDLGFRVLEAAGGLEALEAARAMLPDLILLDISMPGLDGFQVCERLKAEPATAGIPILFLSALLGTQDKLRAFASGGVDYVTKPFQFEEVEARVRTHLDLQRQRRELREQHEALRKLEELRDGLTHMIAHDMRNPLAGIIASLELSLEEVPPRAPGLARKLGMALASAELLNDMIGQMLELSRLEAQAMPLAPDHTDLARLARNALDATGAYAGRRRLAVEPGGPAVAWCDPTLVHRILVNLVGNALKFAPDDGAVTIRLRPQEDRIRVEVHDDGPGIPPEHRDRIFGKFQQLKNGPRSGGVGLGLAFCKAAVDAHQGEIGVESPEAGGCTIWFTLPCADPRN